MWRRSCSYERPDAILPGIGGQTGLNLAMQLDKKGVLARVPDGACSARASKVSSMAEDREKFKELCEAPRRAGAAVRHHPLDRGRRCARRESIGYPVVLRPAFTLGGTGGGFADNEDELREIVKNALQALPRAPGAWSKKASRAIRRSNTRSCATQTTPRSPYAIWKTSTLSAYIREIRWWSAPSQTLTNKEYHLLRDSALKIIRALKIEGGCNVQFALDPQSFELLSYRSQPARFALVGTCFEGERISRSQGCRRRSPSE